MGRNIMAYLQFLRENPILDPSKSHRNLYIDCCTGHCLSCGCDYYGDSAERDLLKCPRCREEKRPYNPDTVPLNLVEIEELK